MQSFKYNNALDAIENTPIALLSNINSSPCNIWAKLEFMQPGGSIKDRAAKRIIQHARNNNLLAPHQPVVEMTSGNMGAGLAVVCAAFKHPFIATMSAGNSPQRAAMLRGLGAKVVLVPQVTGSFGKVTGEDIAAAAHAAQQIAHEKKAFYVNQFFAEEGVNAHYNGTALEILTALNNKIDAFVSVVGSGGTFVGTSKRFKEVNPSILCCAVEPKNAEILAGKPVTQAQHIMQGMGYGIIPPLWNKLLADKFFAIDDTQAKHMQQHLAAKEGYFVGYSAAANVAAALQLAHSGLLKAGSNIVTMLCDTGLKYSFE